ncbi:tetratricopeptide repeat protein [Nibricoccus sp. IMCC34717]|uniref:tetratricopeptide repeat protein n=1 Tax=Nibricoccus sp. IMCC34717 TaxID=3034021 RepID=UPI00384F4510
MFPQLLSRLLFSLAALLFAVTAARADLVWTPQTGWKVQGGVLSGLNEREAKSALGMMNRARMHEEAGNPRRAAKLYERVAKKYPNSIYASEAFYRAARIRFSQEKWQKSFDNFQQVISRYPNSTRFDEIIGLQYEVAAKLLNGARSRILWIIPGFTHRDKGMEFAETMVFNAPYSDYGPLALTAVSRQHERNRDPELAIDALDRLINSYPKNVLTPLAYLRIGELHASLVDGPYYDQASAREAITYFEDFMILFPTDSNVAQAEKNLIEIKKELAMSKVKMAEFYFKKRKNFKAAKVFYNEAITVFPESDVSDLARKRLEEVNAAEAKAEAKAKAEAEANKGKKKKRFWLF